MRAKLLEKFTTEETEHRLVHAGESGDDFITSIPFQVREFFLQAFIICSMMCCSVRLVEISVLPIEIMAALYCSFCVLSSAMLVQLVG
jgi:hypothetical protein